MQQVPGVKVARCKACLVKKLSDLKGVWCKSSFGVKAVWCECCVVLDVFGANGVWCKRCLV